MALRDTGTDRWPIACDMMSDPDFETRERVMRAMLEMKKLDIEGLKRAQSGAAS